MIFKSIKTYFKFYLIIFIFSALSCNINPVEPDFGFDFINNFGKASAFPDSIPKSRVAFVHSSWPMWGDTSRALIINAWGKLVFDIPQKYSSGKLILSTGLSRPFGDGATAIVTVEYGGVIDTVYKCGHVPSVQLNDRKWKEAIIDLSRYNGKAISISFISDPGPEQNADYDDLAWRSPIILNY